MTFQQYLDELARQGWLLRESARQPALRAAVPSCPGWSVSRLLGHVTKVHRWASWIVGGGNQDDFEFSVPEDGQLLEAYDAGLQEVLGRLRAAPDTLAVWTMTPAPSA
ncbi:maleylpyruvate isomerase N-terminal domain-containing protein, partial [Jatrophihabitans sp.]|uniref:maleylpyruvate isomerase N-terminal domain-containing protein n=1 Tax=Jatrophihabitans sp. TaxID=1932789 RepID=UPI0038CD78A8